jgi:hypothetical protein
MSMDRARQPGERPAGVKPPAYLSPNKPVPQPAAPPLAPEHGGRDGPDPTRYGDWENKGIAIDF